MLFELYQRKEKEAMGSALLLLYELVRCVVNAAVPSHRRGAPCSYSMSSGYYSNYMWKWSHLSASDRRGSADCSSSDDPM